MIDANETRPELRRVVSLKRVLLLAIVIATVVVGIVAGWVYALGVPLVPALGFSAMHALGVEMRCPAGARRSMGTTKTTRTTGAARAATASA
jgi:hypothetical protein